MSWRTFVCFPRHYRPLPKGYVVVRTDDHYQWLKLTPDGRDYTEEGEISVDPETYEVRAAGEVLTCEPASVLPMAQRYFLF